MEGEGLQEWADGKKYEGSFKNNQFDGQGMYTFANGNWFKG